MPNATKITITITSNPNPASSVWPAGKTLAIHAPSDNTDILIAVDVDAADLTDVDEGNGNDNANAHIVWEIATRHWEFPDTKGIEIASPGDKFTDKKRDHGNKQRHTWRREKKDGNTYKYTIRVVNILTNATASWDPWVINR